MAVERKYVLTRVEAGDYIFPANDRQTIWRICRYVDGPSMGLEIPRDRQFWGLWKWTRPLTDSRAIDLNEWDLWEFRSGNYDTRQEAIDAALGAS